MEIYIIIIIIIALSVAFGALLLTILFGVTVSYILITWNAKRISSKEFSDSSTGSYSNFGTARIKH